MTKIYIEIKDKIPAILKIKNLNGNFCSIWSSISLRQGYISRSRKNAARRRIRVTARVFETIVRRSRNNHRTITLMIQETSVPMQTPPPPRYDFTVFATLVILRNISEQDTLRYGDAETSTTIFVEQDCAIMTIIKNVLCPDQILLTMPILENDALNSL